MKAPTSGSTELKSRELNTAPWYLAQLMHHPIVRALSLMQFGLALMIFFYAALMPSGSAPPTFPPALLHLVGNILLAISAGVAFFPWLRIRGLLGFTLVISLLAELGQSFTSTRVTDPADIATNIVGLCIGFLAIKLTLKHPF